MAILTVEIIDDEWSNLPEAEIEGIKAGLEDLEAGRIYSHADVMVRIDEKLNLQ